MRGALALAFGLAFTVAALGAPALERLAALRAAIPPDADHEGLRRVLDELGTRASGGGSEDPEWAWSLEVATRLRPGAEPFGRDQRLLVRWIDAMGLEPGRAGWESLRRGLAQAVLDHGGLLDAGKESYRELAAAPDPGAVEAAVQKMARQVRVLRLVFAGVVLGPLLFLGVAWWWWRRRAGGEGGAPPAPPRPASSGPPARGPGAWLGEDRRFRDVERLGAGGMGTVFGAVEVDGGRRVAIKTLASLDAMDAEMCARFLREAKALARLEHPGLPAVYSVAAEPVPHMVMERVEGRSLEELVAQDGPVEAGRVRRWMREAGAALAAAHAAGVIHRDVKPANLMVDGDDHVRVVDFGLAFLADHTRLTRTGQAVGTPAFMPREQMMGEAPSMGTDVYGLCATAFFLLTGRFAYHPMMVLHGEDLPPPEFPAGLPADLAAALQAGLRPARQDRLRTVDELLGLLEE